MLPYLCCPACAGHVTMAASEETRDGEIIHGALACDACGLSYHVHDGIVDFLGRLEPQTPAQVINQTRLAGWAYERLWRPFALALLTGQRFPYRRELPLMVSLAGARRGGLFVDIACSNGLYARALARVAGAAGHIVGVDHSLSMLHEARRRARVAGLRISYVRARAEALPVRSGMAAGMVVGGSLNEIMDVDGTLREVRRVLAADGRFMTMTLTRARSWWGRVLQAAVRPGGVEFRTASEWIAAFRQHGLETIEQQQYRVVLFTQSLKQNKEQSV
ncbi:MAG TPA: class I SAM-dependent methyltransferase [Roseiflexaceae bacterium]|nr:class I SAM-dependent methyltransferase [Roseiflexaceae bacterium]